MSRFHDRPAVTAVLGPTNTGKTYLAIERMLGHASGMIGFPLRLLARENYDRIVRLKGPRAVALMTGEERIVPPGARYFVCTVESMPVGRDVSFLAIDEVQLAADPDRGHVFTDRLLHARGLTETMFLGAETIRPLIQALIPDVEIVTRPRFSQLSWIGPKKLTRLPRRSAIVAFSAQDVYSIAELVRRQRGGAAVVLGALSPRTRNAQVAMFQAGEVEHLVATDAIGMGLNMDIDHVAFAALRKFDGRAPRDLTAAEVAQIAGRAGRHLNDGTFGTTTDVGELEPEVIERVESHVFPPLKGLFWRNRDLRFTSLEALRASLAKPSPRPELIRSRPADDQIVLETMIRDPDVVDLAAGPDRLRLLWEVCQVPDFRKLRPETHARLLEQMFRHLTAPGQGLPTDWMAGHLSALDRIDGDMHALMDRIASIRVWTYVSHRPDWVDDSLHWQGRAREIEDRLSDALHDSLTQRFVDVRTSVLARRLSQGSPLVAAVAANDEVTVEGHRLGRLDGLTFVAEKGESRTADRAVVNAAGKALRGEIARRIDDLAGAPDEAFFLDDQSRVMWNGAPVGRLGPGVDRLRPAVSVPDDEFLDGEARARIRQRLSDWLEGHIRVTLRPLAGPLPKGLSGAARGILWQLGEALGTLPAVHARAQLAALTAEDRKDLARLGIRFGTEAISVQALLKPAAQRLRATLWATHLGRLPPSFPEGRMSFPVLPDLPEDAYPMFGYRVLGDKAVRVDVLERFAAEVRRLLRDKEAGGAQKPLPPHSLNLLGLALPDAVPVLRGLGYEAELTGAGVIFNARMTRRRKARPKTGPGAKAEAGAKATAKGGIAPSRPPPAAMAVQGMENSPFAALRALKIGRKR